MRLLTTTAKANPGFPKLSLSLATPHEGVREVQHLRYKIFIETMGLSALANDDGLDADFHSADLFLMLPLAKSDGRYARHYLKESRPL